MGETLKLFKIIWKSYCTISNIYIVTARKRRLCFYTCLSVHGGEYLGRVHPSWAGTLPGRYPPGQVHPQGRHTPLGRYTPTTVHAGIRSISGRYASHWNAFLFVGFCSGSLCFRICRFFSGNICSIWWCFGFNQPPHCSELNCGAFSWNFMMVCQGFHKTPLVAKKQRFLKQLC